jgi:hypothetical protein
MAVIGVPHAGTICVTGLMVSELHGLELAVVLVGTIVVWAFVVPVVAVPAVVVVGSPVVVDPSDVGASGLVDGSRCPHAATTTMAVNARM